MDLDVIEKAEGGWEAPSGRRKSWRKKNPSGKGYIYRKTAPGESSEEKPEAPVEEQPAPQQTDSDSSAPLFKEGGPGIFGMSRAEVEARIEAASRAGRSEPDLNKSGAKRSWIDLWDRLFPAGTEADMARVPDGHVDPATVVIKWEQLKNPHASNLMRYKPNPDKNKSQTCNTVENLASNDAKHWTHVKELVGDAEPQQILDAMAGKGSRPSDQKMAAIHDLASGLRADWKDSGSSNRERDSAAINTIIMLTGKRRGQVGNYANTGNRGITTLHAGDVVVEGDTIKFDFIGKNKAQNTAEIKDAELAAYISSRKSGKDADDRLFDATDTSVDKALSDNRSPTNKPKDWRTLISTARAMQEFSGAEAPTVKVKPEGSKKSVEMGLAEAVEGGHIDREHALKTMSRKILSVAKVIQEEMNHSNAGMTRDNYIHPEVFDTYLEKHGLMDLKPTNLDPYQKHRRKKSLLVSTLEVLVKGFGDFELEPKLKPFQGTPYYARALRLVARCKRAQAKIDKIDSASGVSELIPYNPLNLADRSNKKDRRNSKDSDWSLAYNEKRKAEAELNELEAELMEWGAENVTSYEKTKKGFTVLVKGEDVDSAEDPNRTEEEDTFHWPPWVLEYGLTERERAHLKAGEELNYRSVNKGFNVLVQGVREGIPVNFVDRS